jgi:Ca2+-binding EF-hand superfamily protein
VLFNVIDTNADQ